MTYLQNSFAMSGIVPVFLIWAILYILKSVKNPKKRGKSPYIPTKKHTPSISSGREKKEYIRPFVTEEKIVEMVPKSVLSGKNSGKNEKCEVIKMEQLFSRLSYKKQLLIMHEIYSKPIGLRRGDHL